MLITNLTYRIPEYINIYLWGVQLILTNTTTNAKKKISSLQ